MTTIKLPKSVRRYVQPRDQEHEAWLSLLWQMYRRSFSKRHVDAFGSASELEEAILGHVFDIPKEKWPSFRPRQRRVTMRDVFRQIRSFSQPTKPKQRPTKQVVNEPYKNSPLSFAAHDQMKRHEAIPPQTLAPI